jgi:hypothetical protein
MVHKITARRNLPSRALMICQLGYNQCTVVEQEVLLLSCSVDKPLSKDYLVLACFRECIVPALSHILMHYMDVPYLYKI